MIQKLYDGWKKKLLIGVGLDTDPDKIPKHLIKKTRNKFSAVLKFNKAIVDNTKDIVLAYKINIAFYEKYGPAGIIIFNKTVEYIKETAPWVFLILDVKRGDIGNTNTGYTVYLEMADAMTISGYFGGIANKPFLAEQFKDKIIFVLAQTSNEGTKIQNLMAEGMPVYLHMTKDVMTWGEYKNCGVVVGATYPVHLLQARDITGPNKVILVPGVGAQGGDLKAVIVNGTNADGSGIIVNLSRSVIYASEGEDFAEKAREEVLKVNAEIADYLELPKVFWKDVRPAVYQDATFKIFDKTKAILQNSHFVYQAGQHGSKYIAKDKVSPDPLAIDEAGRMLADLMRDFDIETVAVPAVGGIVIGHCVARYLSHFKGKVINSIYLEKTGKKNPDNSDELGLTRDYEEYVFGKNIAIIEDITNSGVTMKNVATCLENAFGNVKYAGVVCNRGAVQPEDIGENIQLINLSVLTLDKFEADECPLCAENVPINTTFGHGKDFLASKN